MRDEKRQLAPEIWARHVAKAMLRDGGLDDPHPGTVNEYAGHLRTLLLCRNGRRDEAQESVRRLMGVGPCKMCSESGRPGHVVNAGQWAHCWDCNPT